MTNLDMLKSKANNTMKYRLILITFLAFTLAFCTGKKRESLLFSPQSKEFLFSKKLNFNGISFEIKLAGKKLSIQPTGLTSNNSLVVHEIEGTVLNAEVGDLNNDNSPEVLVYIQSVGSGSYGSVIGYSVNDGKSMSRINLPEVAENPKTNMGYMGHDEFAIVENTFVQRFPVYKPGDVNAKPTGGMRQIQYKLKNREASRQFVVDKIVEY